MDMSMDMSEDQELLKRMSGVPFTGTRAANPGIMATPYWSPSAGPASAPTTTTSPAAPWTSPAPTPPYRVSVPGMETPIHERFSNTIYRLIESPQLTFSNLLENVAAAISRDTEQSIKFMLVPSFETDTFEASLMLVMKTAEYESDHINLIRVRRIIRKDAVIAAEEMLIEMMEIICLQGLMGIVRAELKIEGKPVL